MIRLSHALAAAVVAALLSCSNQSPSAPEFATSADELATRTPTITPQNSHTASGLIGISPVNARVAWASGRFGTFVVTTDGGTTWKAGQVRGAETLQFRDVQGISATSAYLLSVPGASPSRIYKTNDAGATWTLQFEDPNPNGFYDAFAFWTPKHALAFSDSVPNGSGGFVFPVLRTTDGRDWVNIGANLPAAQPGESGFASSGTCVAVQGGKRAWIGTGGVATPRVLATRDGGDTWAAYNSALGGGAAAGIFSVAFRDAFHGVTGGGDLINPPAHNVARSSDGGKTWHVTANAPITADGTVGTIFGLAYARDRSDDDESDQSSPRAKLVVTGPTGAAWSADEGDDWQPLEGVAGFWAVAFADEGTGWLVGVNGTISKITFSRH